MINQKQTKYFSCVLMILFGDHRILKKKILTNALYFIIVIYIFSILLINGEVNLSLTETLTVRIL